MRSSLIAASFATVAMVSLAAPALAQAPRPVPPPPTVAVEIKPGATYTFSPGHLTVVGAGAVAGYVVGNMLFMGNLMPVLGGVAGGFAANYWYFNR
jgi:hypothetical protein